MDKRILYNIKVVARSVLTKGNVTEDKDNDPETVGVEEIVGAHDPFLCIAPSVTKALFSAKSSLQEDHLQHIVNRCSYFSSSPLLSSQKSVKERCSQLSVFAGRNPLVSIS